MAGASNSITTHNVLSGVLNADNVISGLVNTAFNPAYALVTQAGAQIVLFINSNDYKMYAQLKDKSGNLIYTSNIIDLPLETMVVDGRYDSNTKKLILVLDNGNEIEVPLEALINGLVNEDDLIANYYDKDEIDALLNGYWTKIELTQEDIDNWNAKQEYLNQGDGIEISADTILKGNTRQESTIGKNLLNIFNFEMGSISNGNIMSSPYRINNVNNPIEVKPNTTYCISSVLSTQVKGMRCGIHECDENMTFKKDSGWQQLATNPYVFTTENYTKYVKIVFTLSTTSTDVQTNITEDVTSYNNAVDWARGCLFQLKEGNTATSWEPYTGGNPAPNPDYPYPVNVVTGDNEVKVEGKNLLNVPSDYSVTGNTTINITLPAGTYHISCGNVVKGGTNAPAFTGFGAWFNLDPNTDTIRTLNETTQLTIRVYSNGYSAPDSAGVTSIINNLMISISGGNYVPYQSQTYPINLGSMELCKIGDYQDYIYKENGIWYKYGAIKKNILKPTTITLEENGMRMSNYSVGIPVTTYPQIYCEYFRRASNYQEVVNDLPNSLALNTSGIVLCNVSGYTTTTEYANLFNNNDIYVYFPLATPTITPITDTTLISQLNALTTGFSNNWVENISQTNADLSFEIEYNNKNLTISASSNLVRDTDYATTTKAGLIRANNYYGTAMYNEYLIGVNKTYADYGTSPNNMYISKGTLENVITGKELTNKTYVDAADAAFESELFDDGIISAEDSTEANINNTMNKSQLKIDLKGNTSQESTTGKNLMPNNATTQTIRGITFTINEDKSITLNGTNDNTGASTLFLITEVDNFSLNAGTYNSIATGVAGVNIGAYDGTNYYTFAGASGNSITLQNNTSFASVYLQVSKGNSTTFNNKKIYPILSLTPVSESDYEPYTNGPAPNPDYPYLVNVVTGDNEVKIEGKNLLQKQGYGTPNTDSDYWEGNLSFLTSGDDGWGTFAFDNSSGSSVAYKNMMIKNGNVTYKPSTNYTIFVELKDVSKGSATGDMIFLSQGANARDPFSSGEKKITYDEATNKVYRFNVITKADLTNTYAFRTFVAIPAGKNVSFKIRAMIVEGTYTSDTYIPYQSQTYPINLGSMELCKIGDYQDVIKRSSGKNLFDGEMILGYYNESGVWQTRNDILSSKNPIYVNPSESYYFKAPSQAYYTQWTSNGTFISRTNLPQGYGTLTLNSNCAYILFNMLSGYGTTYKNDIMINEGTTALPYEPYGKVWYKYGAIGKVVLDGSENWVYPTQAGSSTYYRYENQAFRDNDCMVHSQYLSDNFKYNGTTGQVEQNVITNTSSAGTNRLWITIDTSLMSGTTENDFKNWLSTHNTTVYYVLATPIVTPITDTTLIEQLDNLEKAYSYNSQTNISQTNQDKPFILDINAIADNVNGLKLENENQEYKTNKVIELSSNSTDDEYPSAKCVYDIVGNIEAVLAAMDSGSGV